MTMTSRNAAPTSAALAGATLLLLAGPAGATDEEEAARRGLALAERWCAECHVVAPGAAGGDAGPPFAAVDADTPEDEGALRAWLFDPHAPMPDLELGPAQIRDVIAHIRRLQTEGGQ